MTDDPERTCAAAPAESPLVMILFNIPLPAIALYKFSDSNRLGPGFGRFGAPARRLFSAHKDLTGIGLGMLIKAPPPKTKR